MKDIGFIIPYFGQFNNYFQLFLNSCKYNTNCDWIIFTDDKREYDYPENVIVYYITFEKMKAYINDKFDFKISLENPYKLCDYRPFYGFIFSEYIKDYRYWGYCDSDMIFGKISNFITEDDLKSYDKIGIMGHCTVYKNCTDINTICLKTLYGKDRAKKVLTEEWNHSFDEEFKDSINNIFEKYKKKIDYREHEANIYRKSSDLRITRMLFPSHNYKVEKKTESFFVWNKGHLFRYLRNAGKISKEEYMYIHLQARPMRLALSNTATYKIIANSFDDLEVEKIDKNTFELIKKKHFNLHYFKHRSKNLLDKIRKKVKRK